MKMSNLESKSTDSITSNDRWPIYFSNHHCNDKTHSLISKSYFGINGSSNVESKNVLTAPEKFSLTFIKGKRPECPFCSYCGVPPYDMITGDVVLRGL